MEDRKFQQILDYFDFSFSGYRRVRKSVKKRVNRHMQELGCRTVSDYLSVLNENDNRLEEARRLMTVSISRFFRDYHMWHILEHGILSQFIQHQHIHIWSAGCACGEEVYSIKILNERLKQVYPGFPKIHVTATDMNPTYIKKAQTGVYSAGSLREIPEPWRELYFERHGKKRQFAVRKRLKKNISWDVRSIETGPSMQHADIIFLRNNLLTYYKSHGQKKAFDIILNSLAASGCLVIGSRESLPGEYPDLKAHPSCAFVYEKSA